MVDGRVVWEGGTRCGRWAGAHVALSDAPYALTHALDQASRGLVSAPSRASSRPPSAVGKLTFAIQKSYNVNIGILITFI